MVLAGFIKKELIQTLRDMRLRVMVLLAPALQIILFGYAITNDVINIRLAGYFRPNDVVAQDIYRGALASKWFIPPSEDVQHCLPEEAIQNGKIDAAFIAPKEGLACKVGRGEGHYQLIINASNVLRARAIENYMQAITHTVCSPEVKAPINIVMRTLYNPTLETTTFIVPGIMAIILVILVMVLTCTSIAKEKERGTFETILSAPIKRTHIILGKTIPFAFVGLFNMTVILMAGLFLFDLPFRGGVLPFCIENILFVTCSSLMGILLSTFVKNQQQSMLCIFIVFFVLMMLSGSFFPIENMPMWLRWISYANPIAHHTFLVRNMLLKGGDAVYVFQHCLAIIAISIAIGIVAIKRFKITLN